MTRETARLDWASVDPFVRGPWATPGDGDAREFEIPAGAARGFRFGRLRSGPRWPEGLPPLDRLAALPAPSGPALPGTHAVLFLEDAEGERTALCAEQAGALRWRVDPADWIRGLLSERYVSGWSRPLVSRVPGLNYSRVPASLKGPLERLWQRSARERAGGIDFPSLPLDDLVEALRGLCAALSAGAAAECRSPWPEGRRAAVTVTHDADSAWILDAARSGLLREILDTERALGFLGAWYVVANRVSPARHRAGLDAITAAGQEIGAHGWNHDARLAYLDPRRQRARLAAVAGRFPGRAVRGMRTPWYARSGSLFEQLADHFSYDSSVPNASGLFSTGSRSGCCSVFPYRAGPGLLELPLTLPVDTEVRGGDAVERLAAVADTVIERRGAVVITLHPQPHQSGNAAGLARHAALLERLATRHGERLWHATPLQITERYAEALRAG